MNTYIQENSAATQFYERSICRPLCILLEWNSDETMLKGSASSGEVNKTDTFITGCMGNFSGAYNHRKDPRKTGKYRVH